MKTEVDLVISINVHENIDFLRKQLKNLRKFVNVNYVVILNCGTAMYNVLQQEDLDRNIIINPDYFDKRWNHGSLLKGMYSNLKYAFSHYAYKIFLIMSSRELFYRKLENIADIYKLPASEQSIFTDYNISDWGWHYYKPTKFFKHIVANSWKFSHEAHEGLAIDNNISSVVIELLEFNPEMREEVFNSHVGSEEHVIQSIAVNYGGYYYIGNGVYHMPLQEVDPKKFTFKVVRDSSAIPDELIAD